MQFKQEITWKTVAKILVMFFIASLLVTASLVFEIEKGSSMVFCCFAMVAYLVVALGWASVKLGDFDNYPYDGDNWYKPTRASRENLFFDPDP